MTVIGKEHEDRVVQFSIGIEFRDKPSDLLINGGNRCRVITSWHRQIRVIVVPLLQPLQRVVGQVEREIDKEGLVAIRSHKPTRPVHHHRGEIVPVFVNLSAVFPQVMAVRRHPIKEVRVVIDAALVVAKRVIKPLVVRAQRRMVTQVPLAHVRRAVAGLFEHFRHRHLIGRQAPMLPTLRRVVLQPSALRSLAREQRGSRWRTHCRPGVKLREPHATTRQCIEVWCVQIFRPVDAQIQRPLIVRHDNDHIRSGSETRARQRSQNNDQPPHG